MPQIIDHAPATEFQMWPFDETLNLARPILCPRALCVGRGYLGADTSGAIINCNGGDGFLIGNGKPQHAYKCTGTRLEGFKLAQHGKATGTAISAVCADEKFRPGRVYLNDLFLCALGDLGGGIPSNFDYGVWLDGGGLNETNKAGLREVYAINVRTVGMLKAHWNVNNVVHGTFIGLHADTASGKAVPLLTFVNCQQLDFYGCKIYGNVAFINCTKVRWSGGYCQKMSANGCTHLTISGGAQVETELNIEAGCSGFSDAYCFGRKPRVAIGSPSFQVRAY